jgi:hypothetical protein
LQIKANTTDIGYGYLRIKTRHAHPYPIELFYKVNRKKTDRNLINSSSSNNNNS